MPDLSPPPLTRLKAVGILIIVLGIAADLGTKSWFEGYLHMDPAPDAQPADRVEVIEGFFAWEGTYNPGVTFGMAANQTTLILSLTVLATMGLLFWFLYSRAASRCLHIGLGLIISGAIGNLYDRFKFSKVRDFILVYLGDPGDEWFKWPNFNIADSCIVIGVGLVMWDALFGYAAKQAKAAQELKAKKKKT